MQSRICRFCSQPIEAGDKITRVYHAHCHNEADRRWRAANKASRHRTYLRRVERDPHKIRARGMVHRLIRQGILVPAREVSCWGCPDEPLHPADMWDHARGHGPGHELDIEPICHRANLRRRKERGEYRNSTPDYQKEATL